MHPWDYDIRVTWSGYVVMARGTKRRPQAPSQGRPSHPEPQSKMQRKRTGPEAPRAGRPRVKVWGNLAFVDA